MSGHDFFIISHDLDELERRVDFLLSPASDYEVTEKYGLCDHQNWQLSKARQQLKQDKEWKRNFMQILYRPFDYRFTVYSDYMFARSLIRYLCHMLYNNLSLCIGRAGQVIGKETWDIAFCSKGITDLNLFYRGGNVNLPLYLYSVGEKDQPDKSGGKEGGVQSVMPTQTKREPNLNPKFIKASSDKLGLTFLEDSKGDLKETFGPEDIFNYAYAVFHSPTYRTRYAEFLKIDFPRLPLTSDKGLFKALAGKGAELVSLHLMESPTLNNLITKYPIPGSNEVEKVSYDDNNRRVYINKTQYFEGVPPEVWDFHIGGYQVCHKWLKDRKGRTLSYDELTHYQKVTVALKDTILLMEEIDELIPRWPID